MTTKLYKFSYGRLIKNENWFRYLFKLLIAAICFPVSVFGMFLKKKVGPEWDFISNIGAGMIGLPVLISSFLPIAGIVFIIGSLL